MKKYPREKRAGGKIMGKIMNIPGIGEFVMLKDAEGNQVVCCAPLKRFAYGGFKVVVDTE